MKTIKALISILFLPILAVSLLFYLISHVSLVFIGKICGLNIDEIIKNSYLKEV